MSSTTGPHSADAAVTDEMLVVLAPVAPPARRTPAPVVVAAVLLAAIVAVGSTRAALDRAPPPAQPPEVPLRFGPNTKSRVEALRDRAVTGLLALRRKEGDFTTRDGAGVDPVERQEATALGVLGLSIAKRMGSKVPGISSALAEARAVLFRPIKRGPGASKSRSLRVSALAASLLALSIGDDPMDRKRVETATTALLMLTEPGPPIQGWAQAITARAYGEIIDTGRSEFLGDDPIAVVPVWENLGDTRDGAEARVSEAIALAIKAAPNSAPIADEIFAKVLDDSIEWHGERTDLNRWVLRAWLASRVRGGDAWFEKALPQLEKAVGSDGKVEGEMYGYPVGRSTSILLILWEGTDLRRPPPR